MKFLRLSVNTDVTKLPPMLLTSAVFMFSIHEISSYLMRRLGVSYERKMIFQ
jgi:hypothetical protein